MLTPTFRTRRLPAILSLGALSLSALSFPGCSTARTTDVLEARLRSQEDMLATYESEMKRVKTELSVARRETEGLRVQMADSGRQTIPAEAAKSLARASGVELSALMTGGADLDGLPGHDGLSVVLIPHDANGELVQLPGTIEIEAFDLSQPGGAKQIGYWTFDQTEAHEYWHKGVIQSGYQFELPWQALPQSDQILVHGHLRTADGRKFDNTLTVRIDPPSAAGVGAMIGNARPAASQNVSPFDIQQVGGQQESNAADDKVIWADGEVSPSRDRLGEHAEPIQRVPRPSPPAQHPLDADKRGVDAGSSVGPGSSVSTSREIPPRVGDWWSDEDWATIDAAPAAEGVQTSDSFTEESLPTRR